MAVDVGIVVAGFVGAGLLLAAAWVALVPDIEVVRTRAGLVTGEVSLGNAFSADGWYAVLAGTAGLLLGLLMMIWRRTHEVVTVLAVAAGGFLAAWVMSQVGTVLGPNDPETVLSDARVGDTAPQQVEVTSAAVYFVWPITALAGSLVVLWSAPGERIVRPRTQPGGRMFG